MQDLKRQQRDNAIIQALLDEGKQRSVVMTDALHQMVDMSDGMSSLHDSLAVASMLTAEEVELIGKSAVVVSAMAMTISAYLAHPKVTQDMRDLVNDLNVAFRLFASLYVQTSETGQQA
jgi:hypothetical protein